MASARILTVPADDNGQRLDRWLKRVADDLPFILVQKLLRKGQIRVDGKRAKGEQKLSAGQDVRLPPLAPDRKPPKKQDISDADAAFIRSLVLYDQDGLIAINKPAGLATQGGSKVARHVDGMLGALSDENGVRPRLVHRLDRETSGLLLLARSAEMARRMGRVFESRNIKKLYWALIAPAPAVERGTIRAPLLKKEVGPDKDKVVVDEKEGKTALTDFVIIDKAANDAAFAMFWPRTGRMHQIRVHAAVLGCPILGDKKYGQRVESLEAVADPARLHLHAWRLMFRHPLTNQWLDLQAPLSDDLKKTWKALGFDPAESADPFPDPRREKKKGDQKRSEKKKGEKKATAKTFKPARSDKRKIMKRKSSK